MSKWQNEDTQTLFRALLSLNTEEECRLFLEDVCTVKEITDMAQRLKVASLLRARTSYAVINQETGVSTATISRVSRCLDYGPGGYDLVLDRLAEEEKDDG
ncbi:MAG: YerC/YecD family TrpR-related protein [Eubacteriales bacterium]|nr:YerC/YecD family TrpR-related protein [Eubacteriales bacterium]